MSNKKNLADKISLLGAVSIGIGGMVGGGIFAVLGLAVSMAKGATPLAFLIAGIITVFTAYSYQKMSLAFPDRGGTVRFLNESFGVGMFSGTMNNLLWVNYIIMLALYASAFGAYAPNLISITGNENLDAHVCSTAILLFSTGINYYSLSVVGKIESFAVILKLLILLAFVSLCGFGLRDSQFLHQLSFEYWVGPVPLIAGGMVIFVAYEGFELIANSAPDIENPKRNISRAYLISVIFVICLYVVIASITVGSLSFDSVTKAEEYVLAEAARPVLGDLGFTIITFTALISTFSAINATILGSSRVNFEVARDKELFPFFAQNFHGKPIGLVVILSLALVLVNTMNIANISIAGSIGFLLVFSSVNFSAFIKAKEISGIKAVFFIGILVFLLVLLICWLTEKIYRVGYQKKNNI